MTLGPRPGIAYAVIRIGPPPLCSPPPKPAPLAYKQFVIDGEAVVLGVDGISDFNALHSGKLNHEVQLYAFDILATEGDDLRSLPLSMRKASLAKLLHRRPSGIFLGGFEQGEIGPDLCRHLSDDLSRQQTG